MNKKEFLERCSAQWDSWKLNEKSIEVMYYAVEYVNRKQGWQDNIAKEKWDAIQEISNWRTLANYTELYNAFNFTARLAHPCQLCAKDKDTWSARWGFCNHKK